MHKALYFVWFLEDDQIILRRAIEFKFALQYFYDFNKIPSFKFFFEDGDNEGITLPLIQVPEGTTRSCLTVNSVVPVIDF